MPIGEVVSEIVGQLVMEAGGNAIHRKLGWIGCVAVIAAIVCIVALVIWLVQ